MLTALIRSVFGQLISSAGTTDRITTAVCVARASSAPMRIVVHFFCLSSAWFAHPHGHSSRWPASSGQVPAPSTNPRATPTAAPMVGCMDSPGWRNGKGIGCAKYASLGYCSNGRVAGIFKWALGAQHNFPERNCCACGKERELNTTAFLWNHEKLHSNGTYKDCIYDKSFACIPIKKKRFNSQNTLSIMDQPQQHAGTHETKLGHVETSQPRVCCRLFQ